MTTQITCTKCRSLVPWGPYGPRCDAYLEFAGEPAWDPAGPPPEVDAEHEATIGGGSDAGAECEVEAGIETASVEVVEAEVPVAPAGGAPRWRPARSTWVVGAFVVLACAVATALMVVAGVPWGAVATAAIGVVLLVVVFWPPRSPEPPQLPAEAIAVVVAEEREETVELVDTTQPLVPIVARAPQEIPPTATEATPVLAVREPIGDVPCPACGRGNLAGRAFCAWCGAVMEGAALEPATHAVSPAEVAEGEAVVERRLTRSWRVPIIAIALAGVFLTSLATALFGPQAFRVRLGITNVYQAIAEFVNPYAGNTPRAARIEASSSLAGTSPASLYGSDARTFWASASAWGYGAGTEITVAFDGPKEINRLVLFPGTQGTQFGVNALATPRDITLRFDDGSEQTVTADRVAFAGDYNQLLDFDPTVTETVTMVIDSVYPPKGELDTGGFGEVAISALYFIEQPRPPQIITLPTAADPPRSFGWG